MSVTSIPHAARVRRANGRRINPADLLRAHAGCYGNCNQGRAACTMPGVCGRVRHIDPHALSQQAGERTPRGAMPPGDFANTVPVVAPPPAEACSEIGCDPDDTADERSRMQGFGWLLVVVAAIVGVAALAHLLARAS